MNLKLLLNWVQLIFHNSKYCLYSSPLDRQYNFLYGFIFLFLADLLLKFKIIFLAAKKKSRYETGSLFFPDHTVEATTNNKEMNLFFTTPTTTSSRLAQLTGLWPAGRNSHRATISSANANSCQPVVSQ